ncbi:JAB domain-containing protein [Priestia flexa]|uniref:JAB domain-containing protein n=1 Tax=Priestia flexa TaxID=86664 RepID=A0ABU4JC35_9BACI|nr:JAB domain-containing protein [Priestia flexa]MDW8518577.1 JAB domain-containing protein [Priestia flexa]QCS54154.1 DNA repair protein RadC [Priestia flexa]
MVNYVSEVKQLQLFKKPSETKQHAKRVNIVSVKMVKENSFLYPRRNVKSPEDAFILLKQFLGEVDREYFIVVCLDTKNQPTAINVCHMGSLNASIVHPREVLKVAILSNSASIIVGHNHPSNDPTPSREDIEVTKRLTEAGKIVGIDILYHIIMGTDNFISLKEKGYV